MMRFFLMLLTDRQWVYCPGAYKGNYILSFDALLKDAVAGCWLLVACYLSFPISFHKLDEAIDFFAKIIIFSR